VRSEGGELRGSKEGEAQAATTPGELLRLLGGGVAGAIVMTLGDRSLRTGDLADQVQGYAPRTVYRHARRLADIGVIEREEGHGVPSKVVHRLTDPCGMDFRELVDAFASTSLDRLPDGEVVPHSWRFVTLMADLWEGDMFRVLNDGPCTPTMLARANGHLSVHQISRRITLSLTEGLLRVVPLAGIRPYYELTDRGRRGTALIAALGRWRERHLPAAGHGLTAIETADLLATLVPLARMRRHHKKHFVLAVLPDHASNGDGAVVAVKIRRDGAVVASGDLLACIGSWGKGLVSDWLDMAIDGPAENGLQFNGPDAAAVKACLTATYAALWAPSRTGEAR
jgi:DNA-binding HxlR family transcriptional regulator